MSDYKAFVLKLITDLQEFGASIDSIVDGEDEYWFIDQQDAHEEMVDVACGTDSAYFYVTRGDEQLTILLIYGNDLEETVADWRANPDGELWAFVDKWTDAL